MKKVLIALIRLYQRTISGKSPPVCRFTPTCSAYAIEAIERFGVIKGGGLAIWRILRCNPFGKYGYDPVPEKKPKPRRRGGAAGASENDSCSPDAGRAAGSAGSPPAGEGPDADPHG